MQDVPYAKLRERLLADGQVLEYTATAGARRGEQGSRDPEKLAGIVVDDAAAKLTGTWKESRVNAPFVGGGYRHEDHTHDGHATARFETKLPKAGRYEVRLAYPPNANRASNVPVEIQHAGGSARAVVNQKSKPAIDDLFVSLGTFDFTADQPAAVVITNAGTDGYVVIDAVQWLPR